MTFDAQNPTDRPAPVRARFGLDPALVFLNHGSFGACPTEVLEALWARQRALERNPVEFLGRRSAALLRDARQTLAGFLGAQTDDLAFVPNATTGVNIVARSLALAPGDEVLATDLEYGACDATFERACAARGAHYRRVAMPLPFDDAAAVAALAGAIGPRTRLVFLSHIASTTALVLPVAALVQAAHARGVPVLVDAAHAPGQVELQLDATAADFTTGNCHKWLCAPKGTAFLHVRPPWQARIEPPVVSWGAVADALAAGAGGHTGFDAYVGRTPLERSLQWLGTRDPCAFLTVPDAIAFHRTHLAPLAASCRAQAAALHARAVARWGLEPLGAAGSFAQMVPLPVPACDAEALRHRLFERHRIEVPVTQHRGRCFVRVSVAGYTSADELAALERALEQCFG